MKSITSKQLNDLITKCGQTFPTFGGGQVSNYNPLANTLSNKPYQFAAGVHVKNVVSYILSELEVNLKD